MLDRADIPSGRVRAIAPEPLPVSAMMRGKPVAEVVDLLPRLFNLCRGAQATALNLALGLEGAGDDMLVQEIRNDHLLRLAIVLPQRLGLDRLAVPFNDPAQLPNALFGAPTLPDNAVEFDDFLRGDSGIAPILRAIRDRFAPGEATCPQLPPVGADMTLNAAENSVAARHLDHPILCHVEAQFGRGPYWRVTARAVDLDALLHGDLPAPRLVAPHTAVVPAARGQYMVRARAEAGRITDLHRITPTDHMLAPGGILEHSLATLPASKHDQAALLVDILDPCVPIRLEGLTDA
ncbi:hydrogenase expression/formation protein HupK [Aquicoccus sp. SU-CL01552]|uniref:hydrogenase expression/formation protein HupK n=1 Tax=Aquicoccus sp. SU-CL01552 TaxID=3127656 RepID=UPI0031029613